MNEPLWIKHCHGAWASVVNLNFRSPGQPFRSQFVLYLALWTGLACATRLSRSTFMLHIDWIYFYYRGRFSWEGHLKLRTQSLFPDELSNLTENKAIIKLNWHNGCIEEQLWSLKTNVHLKFFINWNFRLRIRLYQWKTV